MQTNFILIRGAGDLASGVALRLFRAGLRVVMTEAAEPLAVRRTVSFSEAVISGKSRVEEVTARSAGSPEQALKIVALGEIPVLVDPDLRFFIDGGPGNRPAAIVDARLLKIPVPKAAAELVIGLGPGFTPGDNCDAAVETMRGHTLGRVYWDRPPLENTGLPDGNPDRVLRSPAGGVIRPRFEITNQVQPGDVVAEIEEASGRRVPVITRVGGVLRGMLRDGARVPQGLKIGDVDERGDVTNCLLVSDKSLAVGGGVLEAVLSRCENLPDLFRKPRAGAA